MPSAGGVCPPVIIPLRENYDGKSCNNISSHTYVELETETPECKIYFTTDGSKPLPYQSKYADGKSTFIYKGPFHLKPGKRTLKALAVTRDGLKESDVVTKTFNVKEPKERGSDIPQVPHTGKVKSRSKKNHSVVSSTSSSSSCETLNIHEVDDIGNNNQLQSYSNGFEMPHASFSPQSNPFNPQSHSGTQINLWGFPPPQVPHWSAGGIPNSFYSLPQPHLGYMTTRALENLNQPKLPLHDLKKIIREEGDRLLVKNTQMQFQLANQIKQNEVNEMQKQESNRFYANDSQDSNLTETSPGNGNWKGQMKHILGHLKEKILNDGQLQKKLANYKLGRISEVIIEDDDADNSLEINLIFSKFQNQRLKPEEKFQSKPKQEISKITELKPENVKAEGINSRSKQNPISNIVATRAIASKYKDVKSKIDSNFSKPSTGGKSKKEEFENSTKNNTRKDPFYETEEYHAEGTLKEWPRFSAEDDCERLRKAMKGLGTDEAAIIEVLGYRISRQRAQVVKLFKTMFGKDLLKELESELSGNFLTCCKSLCLPPPDFDATELRKAIKGLGTDEDVLIEILCTRTNKQLQSIVAAYKQLFQRDLEKDLSGDTSGHFRKVLVAQVQGNRSEELTFDLTQVHDDVDELLGAGQNKWGTDESVFNKILCQRSFPHLRSLMKEYKKKSKKNASLQDSIRAEFSGDVRKALLTIVNVVEDKPGFFADKLHKAMKGLGTDDDALIRIVVSRCECDMVQIKQAFYGAYGKHLSDWIKDDISGDYLKIILALIGERTSSEGDSKYSSAKKVDDNDAHDRYGDDDDVDEKENDDDDDEEEEDMKKREPTLLPCANFDVKKDCEALRKAMKGLGTDEDGIIDVLTNRSSEQRMEIVNMFKTMFGKDLIKELKSELNGNLSHVMTALCKTRSQFAADELRKAMKGLGTDEDCLIDILCTRTNQELQDISSEFKQRHGKNLEECLMSETSGHLKRLFVSLSQCNRPTTRGVKRGVARKDAKDLWQAGELKKFGTDESRFNVVLCSRSYAQLRATFEEYHKLSGKDIVESIKSEMSGDLKRALIAIVECIRDDVGFYARSLYDSMHGLGTNDDKLIRVIVSRSEIDMTQIKERFKVDYKQTLAQYIKDDTSGDYRKSLLSLIDEK